MESAASEKVMGILLRRVHVRGDFLSIVREEAATTGKPLEKLLIERRLVTPADLTLALAEYTRIPPITLLHFTPDEELLNLIPKELLSQWKVVPLSKMGNTLFVALADPFNIPAVEQIAAATHLEVIPLAAPEPEVDEQLDRIAGPKSDALNDAIRGGTEEEMEVTSDKQVEADVSDLEQQATGAPVIRVVNSIMIESLRKHASDIHLEPMEKALQIRYRIDGILYNQPSPPKIIYDAIVSRIKILSHLNIAEHRIPQDGRFRMKTQKKECDVRVSLLPTVHGEKIVMRILDKSALTPSLAALGLDQRSYENIKFAISQPHGMVLVTGPTGSGKTTTLYSALQELNQPDVNIVTIEDPVEYQMNGINQVQTHADIGLTFAHGLRSILRQSPDIIMVGEIRDDETAAIAVQAAVTGHLVFSTLHTNDSAGAVARMLYMGIDGYMLASSILCAQAQRLYRKLCPACREETTVPTEVLRLHRVDASLFEGARLYKAVGCPKCAKTGYKGRGALMEILLVDSDLRELIRKGPSANVIRNMAVEKGMPTLRDTGLLRAKEGVTSVEEILMVTSGE